MQGTLLIGYIVANVIAFVAFVAFLNAIVSWFGGLVGIIGLTFEVILTLQLQAMCLMFLYHDMCA
jgi:pyrimidine nucleoside transport protein